MNKGHGRLAFVVPFGAPIFPFSSLGWLGVSLPQSAFAPPTIVVLPAVVLNAGAMDHPNINPAAKLRELPPDDDMLPGAKPGDHFVIRPKKALPLLPPPEPIPIAPKMERPELPVPRPRLDFDPLAERKMVNVEKTEPDPAKEMARLIKLGKNAIASGEFGAANEQFDRAIAAAPKSALPVFLKAQAEFAAGRYGDAVTAIRAGLELDRNWPSSPFDPKELYGENARVFNEHLAALRGVIAANPDEPTLEFLLGYELWFIGEKTEARKWFDAAGKRLPAPGPIALFK